MDFEEKKQLVDRISKLEERLKKLERFLHSQFVELNEDWIEKEAQALSEDQSLRKTKPLSEL